MENQSGSRKTQRQLASVVGWRHCVEPQVREKADGSPHRGEPAATMPSCRGVRSHGEQPGRARPDNIEVVQCSRRVMAERYGAERLLLFRSPPSTVGVGWLIEVARSCHRLLASDDTAGETAVVRRICWTQRSCLFRCAVSHNYGSVSESLVQRTAPIASYSALN